MNVGSTRIKVVVHDTANNRILHGKTGNEPL